MINGLYIFYRKVNNGSGLRIVENESGNGLKLISTKGKGCNMKPIKKQEDLVLKFYFKKNFIILK